MGDRLGLRAAGSGSSESMCLYRGLKWMSFYMPLLYAFYMPLANHSMAVTDDSTITGTNITIEASSSITLVVGGSAITIEAGGIIVT